MADPPRTGLYADLLGDGSKKPAQGTVISAAPVSYSYKVEQAAEPVAAIKKKDAALQFSPRAPQPKAKAKPRPAFNNNAFKPVSSEQTPAPQTTNTQTGKDISYWIQQGNDAMDQPKPKRYNKSKKEKRQDALARRFDEIYDPTNPCNYREYKGSGEQEDERREWKDLLYSAAGNGRRSSKSSSTPARPRNAMFAPPPMDTSTTNTTMQTAPATLHDDATGEDAYARRAAMAATNTTRFSPSTQQPARPTQSPSPAPSNASNSSAKVQQQIAELKARLAEKRAYDASIAALKQDAQPALSGESSSTPGLGATISRAPVMYQQPRAAQAQGEEQRSSPPPSMKPVKSTKVGLGQRLLEKQGWTAGQGLGANEDGITSIVHVQAEKRRKRPDGEGGGFVTAPMGKITGGKRKAADDSGPAQSTVVKVAGILGNMDVRHAIEEDNLQQQLGTFFDDRFGKVKRVFIWTADRGGHDEVFVEFVDALSALRAVSPHKQHVFGGSDVVAVYFDAARFEAGDYADL